MVTRALRGPRARHLQHSPLSACTSPPAFGPGAGLGNRSRFPPFGQGHTQCSNS